MFLVIWLSQECDFTYHHELASFKCVKAPNVSVLNSLSFVLDKFKLLKVYSSR